jgi:hypothetical protein
MQAIDCLHERRVEWMDEKAVNDSGAVITAVK